MSFPIFRSKAFAKQVPIVCKIGQYGFEKGIKILNQYHFSGIKYEPFLRFLDNSYLCVIVCLKSICERRLIDDSHLVSLFVSGGVFQLAGDTLGVVEESLLYSVDFATMRLSLGFNSDMAGHVADQYYLCLQKTRVSNKVRCEDKRELERELKQIGFREETPE